MRDRERQTAGGDARTRELVAGGERVGRPLQSSAEIIHLTSMRHMTAQATGIHSF